MRIPGAASRLKISTTWEIGGPGLGIHALTDRYSEYQLLAARGVLADGEGQVQRDVRAAALFTSNEMKLQALQGPR